MLLKALALIQAIAIVVIAYFLFETRVQVQAIPEKVDILIGSIPEPIVNCPECPRCPENKDYGKDLEEIKKLIKTAISKLNNTCGYYYSYGR